MPFEYTTVLNIISVLKQRWTNTYYVIFLEHVNISLHIPFLDHGPQTLHHLVPVHFIPSLTGGGLLKFVIQKMYLQISKRWNMKLASFLSASLAPMITSGPTRHECSRIWKGTKGVKTKNAKVSTLSLKKVMCKLQEHLRICMSIQLYEHLDF